ncbi:MAG: RNA-binding domain-containing protein [Candidatus Bathyarchaeales archaeon]
MDSKLPIGYITIRAFAHATEDPEKVLTAIRNTLPKELGENAVFQKTSLTGHHKNPIILFETKLADREQLPSALAKIAASLSTLDKEKLAREIRLHVEKQNLYLRFNKQSAYQGELRLSSSDPIHFRIHFRNKTPSEIMEICRNAGVLP